MILTSYIAWAPIGEESMTKLGVRIKATGVRLHPTDVSGGPFAAVTALMSATGVVKDQVEAVMAASDADV